MQLVNVIATDLFFQPQRFYFHLENGYLVLGPRPGPDHAVSTHPEMSIWKLIIQCVWAVFWLQ